ncbi:MAG: hypothetical protein AAB845_00870, partial [Patescibacteria group bacterium]
MIISPSSETLLRLSKPLPLSDAEIEAILVDFFPLRPDIAKSYFMRWQRPRQSGGRQTLFVRLERFYRSLESSLISAPLGNGAASQRTLETKRQM